MGYSTHNDPKHYAGWEQDPSTRESVRLHTKAYPVDVTLTTPGTAENLISVSPGKATVNIVTNPSMETGDPPTGYTAVRSATLAQDATYYKYGSYSMIVTPPNADRGEGAYFDIGIWPKDVPLAISAYFRRGAAGSPTVRVELVAPTTPWTAVTNARVGIGNTITCDGTWQRSYLSSPVNRTITKFDITGASAAFVEDETITGATSGATAVVRTVGAGNDWLIVDSLSLTPFGVSTSPRYTETITGATSLSTATLVASSTQILTSYQYYLYLVTAAQTSTAFYVDGVQAEAWEEPTDYCDGSQGLFHWWDGTAHASTSRRWRKLSSIRSYRLHTTRDVYLAYDRTADRTATNACDRGELIVSGTDFGEDHPIYLDDKISMINVNVGESPRVYGLIWGV